MRTNNPKTFFTKSEEEKIVAAIKIAEKKTSGEIRVHLEKKTKGDIFEFAKKKFEQLKMTETKERNGCLILLDLTNRKFAVIGDKGIDEKVGNDFWKDAAIEMQNHFVKDEFAEGLSEAILKIGEKLKLYFPHQKDDVNELSDEISK